MTPFSSAPIFEAAPTALSHNEDRASWQSSLEPSRSRKLPSDVESHSERVSESRELGLRLLRVAYLSTRRHIPDEITSLHAALQSTASASKQLQWSRLNKVFCTQLRLSRHSKSATPSPE